MGSRRIVMLGLLATVGLVAILGVGVPGLAAQGQGPEIREVELSDGNKTIWLATSEGLLHADPMDFTSSSDDQGDIGVTINTDDPAWQRETIAGETDRSITDFEALIWPRDEDTPAETLIAVSDGVIWVRINAEWTQLQCADATCPSINRLSNTFDDENDNEHNLLAIGDDGIWVLVRNPTTPGVNLDVVATDASAPGWRWVELDRGEHVSAVAQDRLGRVWSVSDAGTGPRLNVYDLRRAIAGDPAPALRRSLPGAPLPNSIQVALSSDSRGGMWIGLPDGVLWMDQDLAIRDELKACELAASQDIAQACPAESASHTVMSVDNDLSDVWVGAPAGLSRVSVGEQSGLGVSTPVRTGAGADQQIVSTARNLSGGDVWVATASLLARVEIDRWSEDSTFTEAITLLAVGQTNESTPLPVFAGTAAGVHIAHWDENQLKLSSDAFVEIDGLITDHSKATSDGRIFIASTQGITRLTGDGQATVAVDFAGERVSAVGHDGARLYIGTAAGAFSAPLDEATAAGAFTPIDTDPTSPDVSAIWTATNRTFIGTAGSGLLSVDPSFTPCGSEPPKDAVIRSAAATSDDSFVMVSSDGVYFATSVGASSVSPSCNVVFERIASSDTNTAVGATVFRETVASQAQDRSRLVWTGSDHGIDLVAWPGTWDDVPDVVTTQFSSSAFFGAGRVTALESAGSGTDTTLIVGTDRGIFYHSPARGQPSFSAQSLTAFDEERGPSERACPGPDGCTKEDLEHGTTAVQLELKVDDLADADQFQFIVTDEELTEISDRVVRRDVERGRQYELTITALDRHLHRSGVVNFELSVKRRTAWQWFRDTNADLITALVVVAILGGLIGNAVVRRLRRIGEQNLRDLEIAMVKADDHTRVVVQAEGKPLDADDRVIATHEAAGLWEQIRTNEAVPADIEAVGSVLWDQLISRPAEHDLRQAGLGKRDVRLRLRGLDDELDALPWESLRDVSGGHIARGYTSIVRDLRKVDSELSSVGESSTAELSDIPPQSSWLSRVSGSLRSLVPWSVLSIFGGANKGPSSGLPEVQRPIRILLVVAEPDGQGRIAGAEVEQASIQEAARTKFRRREVGIVEVMSRTEALAQRDDSLNPTPENLKAILRKKPGWDFVHIIAHGEHTGRGPRIWLEDEDGDPVRMESDELCDLLNGTERGTRPVRLVVLNTCLSAGSTSSGFSASGLASNLVREGNVPAVVGMAMEIQTDAAKKFTAGFYRTVMRHGQVDYAMLVARREIAKHDPNWLAPRLYVGTGASDIFGGG